MGNFIKKYDIITRLLSIVIAIVMWMWASSINNPIVDLEYNDIVVEIASQSLIREANSLVIVENEFPKVAVTLTGEREIVTRVSPQNIIATADISHITEPGTYDLSYNVKLPFDGISVKRTTPQRVTVVVDKMEQKEVKLDLVLEGTPKEGYIYDEIELQETIVVSAPTYILDEIERGEVRIDVDGRKTDINGYYSITYLDEGGNIVTNSIIKSEIEEFNIQASVKIEKEVDVVMTYENDLVKQNIESYSIIPEKLTIIGIPSVVEGLTEIEIGEITQDDLIAKTNNKKVEIPEIEGITFERKAEITISIEYKDETSMKVNLENLQLSPDYEKIVNIIDETLEIEIFASAENLTKLKTENIIINPKMMINELEEMKSGEEIEVEVQIVTSGSYSTKESYFLKIQVK